MTGKGKSREQTIWLLTFLCTYLPPTLDDFRPMLVLSNPSFDLQMSLPKSTVIKTLHQDTTKTFVSICPVIQFGFSRPKEGGSWSYVIGETECLYIFVWTESKKLYNESKVNSSKHFSRVDVLPLTPDRFIVFCIFFVGFSFFELSSEVSIFFF